MQQQNDRINHPAPNQQAGQQAGQDMNQDREQPTQGGDQGSPGRRNPADNLTRDARVRGGMHSAKNQQRDAFGQFAGRKGSAEDASRTVRGRRARGRSDQGQTPPENTDEGGQPSDNR